MQGVVILWWRVCHNISVSHQIKTVYTYVLATLLYYSSISISYHEAAQVIYLTSIRYKLPIIWKVELSSINILWHISSKLHFKVTCHRFRGTLSGLATLPHLTFPYLGHRIATCGHPCRTNIVYAKSALYLVLAVAQWHCGRSCLCSAQFARKRRCNTRMVCCRWFHYWIGRTSVHRHLYEPLQRSLAWRKQTSR